MKQRFLFLFTFLLTFPYGMCDNYLIINQILYDTPLNEVITSTPYSNGEFIELYNGGTDSVSLKGWYLRGDGKTEIYQFPDSISIASRHYLIVAYRHKTTPDFSLLDMLMTSPPQHLQIIYQQDIVLANGGETISLYNASNEIVDQIYYDGTSHKTNPKRLCADNADGLAGHLCGSIRRSWVEFDETGHAIISASKWITSKVALSCALMHELFTEEYIAGEQPLSYDANYRISVTPLDATSRISCNDGKISMSSGIRTQSTIQYHDGLGRDYESITISACPDKRDLVNFTQYSGLDRPTKYWLPISRKTDGQPISETDYIAEAQSVYSDSRSYYEVEYEKSALNRVAGKKKPGEKWAQHAYTYSYDTNTEIDNVRIYSISSGGLLGGESGEYLQTANTTYAPSSLTKITACDEDGMRLTTFYDKLGRKIMERRSENITYYVYNDKGQLRYILPHKAAQHLTNGTYNLEQEISLIENAYCYQYDERGNIIYKRLPGCEPQYLVYDRMNHLVLKQDANQRIHDKWTLYAYDSIGRNLYSAEIQTTETHQSLINKFRNQWQVEHYSTGKQSNALGKTGYAISLMHSSDVKILIVNYYDTYDFLNRLSSDSKTALKYVHQEGYGIIHNDATGLLTGTHIYSLEEDCASVNTYYYDYKGRIIQNKTLQISGACHCLYTEYNFDGSIAKQLIEHSEGTQITTEHYRHTYDHAGRLTNTLYQLNNKPEIVLCHYTYDNLGRMIQNTRHNYSDTLHYSYDLRNATTLIQSEHFSEQLYYADSLENNMTACYNGNISASKITHNKEEHQYTYTYDGMNRLTDTHSLVKLSNSNTILKRNCEHMGYDILGNIVTLQRYDEEKLVDDLMYSYVRGGNQVHSITDYADPSDMALQPHRYNTAYF